MRCDEWVRTTWGDISTLEYGKALRTHKTGSGAIPVYGTNGPIGFTQAPLQSTDGVIIGRKGAYRGVHYSPGPFYVIDTAFFLKQKENASYHTKWAYYCLLTYDINSMDSGSAIPSTSRSDFYSLPVLLPPIAEQRAIAATLSCLDDKIELNNRMNKTLEDMAQALFKSWFVDFDPVKAKMEGREPAGMDAETAALFPDEFEDSELGPIPKGWRVGVVDDLCAQLASGGTPSTRVLEYYGGSINWFSTKELQDGFLLKSEKTITDIGLSNSSAKMFPAGTVVMAIYAAPTVGRLGILTEPSTFNQAAVGMVPNEHFSSTEHLFLLLHNSRRDLNNLANGAAQQNLNVRLVRGFKCLVPSTEVARAFNHVAAPLFEAIKSGSLQSNRLSSLRDTLLPKLMSGEIRVPEAEDILEEVL